ncbi:MAG: glycosyltransferase family 2 protein [Cyanobacteria bacterium J06623_7]
MTKTPEPVGDSRLAIIMTCHNRRELTLSCLERLKQQQVNYTVYLVDDGSTDDTSPAVRQDYPEVKLLSGDGNLFWAGGMRLAFGEALKGDYDYYVWLNDDTMLNPDAFKTLLAIHRDLSARGYDDSIVVGSTQDPLTGKPTYGGAVKSKRWYSNKLEFLEPGNELQECDTMYGNCVFIPRAVAQKVGNIDSAYVHSLGDIDYGLRARQAGCTVWAAPGFVGTCAQNAVAGSWIDPNLSVRQRLKKVVQVKNFPFSPWTAFTKRHSGSFWFFFWCLPYIRAIIGYRDLSISPTFSADAPAAEEQNK